jgi:hypothetical protein
MTRLRVRVNPESRDILLVHAQEKLGEINVSFVLPLPQQAPSEIARLALARLQSAKKGPR